ncbi:MAG: phosphatidylglycerophosphatase A family protein [Parvibaculales bacterium]
MFQKIPPSLRLWYPSVFLASLAGIGFVRKMPGTIGSLIALPTGYAIYHYAPLWVLLIAILIALCTGLWASHRWLIASPKDSDPQSIIIDELVGQWIAMAAIAPYGLDIFSLAIAFCLFRFFDIIKPWPVYLADRRKDAIGIMLDDVIAGSMAAGLIYLVLGAKLL